jgi:hypothetical protein
VDKDSLNPNPDPEIQVNLDPTPIRNQGFDDQKLKKKKTQIKNFLDQKLQFTYVQDTREAFSPQKQTSSQCCGSGSEIRYLFGPWNWDGSEKRHSFVKYIENNKSIKIYR